MTELKDYYPILLACVVLLTTLQFVQYSATQYITDAITCAYDVCTFTDIVVLEKIDLLQNIALFLVFICLALVYVLRGLNGIVQKETDQ